MAVGTTCPHCRHIRTVEEDNSVEPWKCPACGMKYYESPSAKPNGPGMIAELYNALFVRSPDQWPPVSPCKSCRKAVSREAAACPHCGQPDPYMPPVSRVPYDQASGRDKGFFFLFLAAAAFMFFTVITAVFSPATKRIDEAGAIVACHDGITWRLKSPSTAKFVSTSWYGDEAKITVKGEIDAQNSFGAMLRKPYICRLSRYPGNPNWLLDSAVID